MVPGAGGKRMSEHETENVLGRFAAELRRRRVIRVAIAYVIVGWAVIRVFTTILPHLNLPDWTATLVIVLVGLGFPIAVIMAWMFDLGPRGLARTPPAALAPATTSPAAASSPPAAPPAVAAVANAGADRRAADAATLPRPVLRHDPEPDRRTIAVLP